MKQTQPIRSGKVFFVLSALVCVVSLALPGAVAMWDDSRLYAAPVARPVIAGTLGSQGRTVSVAYELFRKRMLSGTEITAAEQISDPAKTAEVLRGKTQVLAAAGVISSDLEKQILHGLSETKSALVRDQDGLSEGICQQWGSAEEEEQTGWQCDVQWLDSCGLVTAYSVTSPASDLDAAAVLVAYREYLGLNALDDWQTVDTKSPAHDTAAMWSSEGQIYLFCCAGKNRFTLEAVSLTQDSLDSQ